MAMEACYCYCCVVSCAILNSQTSLLSRCSDSDWCRLNNLTALRLLVVRQQLLSCRCWVSLRSLLRCYSSLLISTHAPIILLCTTLQQWHERCQAKRRARELSVESVGGTFWERWASELLCRIKKPSNQGKSSRCTYSRSRCTMHDHWPWAVSFDILSRRGPIKTISGVLKSSHQALSFRRVMRLIGRLFTDRMGQKRGYFLPSSARSGSGARISQPRSKLNVDEAEYNTIWQPLESSFEADSIRTMDTIKILFIIYYSTTNRNRKRFKQRFYLVILVKIRIYSECRFGLDVIIRILVLEFVECIGKRSIDIWYW